LSKLRALWRVVLFLGMTVAALTQFLFLRDKSLRGRAQWRQRWSVVTLRIAGVTMQVKGEVPLDGLLVSNHMGYLDVVTLGAVAPVAFVSKSEVRSWPVAGALTRAAGTIYVDRASRTATVGVTAQMKERLEAGVPVMMFPEGTSTDGAAMLPFRTALFEAPAELGATIHMASLRYTVPGDANPETVKNRVAYWDDTSFGVHVFRLLAIRRIDAFIEFSPVIITATERKKAAAEAEAVVRGMLEQRPLAE
jgi:lyso-ornithine lipid O-acyltransferase